MLSEASYPRGKKTSKMHEVGNRAGRQAFLMKTRLFTSTGWSRRACAAATKTPNIPLVSYNFIFAFNTPANDGIARGKRLTAPDRVRLDTR